MAGFGSGLAHALTQGVTSYEQGTDDRMKQIIALAAQKRAEERANEDMNLKRLGTLGALAGAGMDVSAVVPDTASRRVVQGQNPTSPEAGPANPAPAQPSDDGTVIGAVGNMAIKIPPGGPQSKAVRDATVKARERLDKLTTLNDSVTDPKQKKSPNQLQAIAQDDGLYNQYVARATGVVPEPRDPIADHRANRLFDVQHPTRDVSGGDNTSWQTVTTADGSMVQVNPKTGATRPIGLQARTPVAAGGQSTIQGRQAAAVIPELSAAAAIIDRFDDPTMMSQMAKKAGLFGNYLNTPEGRQLNQAITQFVTLSEMAKGNKRPTEALMQRFHDIYAPAPGDDAETREQKRQSRKTLIASVTAVAGNAMPNHDVRRDAPPSAPLAAPTVQTVDEMIKAGKSDAEIKAALLRGRH